VLAAVDHPAVFGVDPLAAVDHSARARLAAAVGHSAVAEAEPSAMGAAVDLPAVGHEVVLDRAVAARTRSGSSKPHRD